MSLKAYTPYPEEVAQQFAAYADVLDIYASDQIASLRWPGGKQRKKIAAEIYKQIADEIREIKFERAEASS